jgi:predicted phage-related endonuclease|tara:strand:+ start:1461 stop:2444 length:984 start_codon:yes stop_codon:yes gene_type:complete
MKTKKIDHTAEAVGKLTPDYEISCSLLEPIITGQNPYQTRNQVLENCHKALKGEDIRIPTNNYMEVGNVLEKPVAELAAKRIGLLDIQLVVEEAVRHNKVTLNGSIDCIGVADNLFITKDVDKGFYCPELEDGEGMKVNGKGVVEIKITNAPLSESLPTYRGVIQVKGLMAITEYSWAVVCVLNGSDLRMYFYQRDEQWEKEVLEPTVIDFNNRIAHCDWYDPFDTKEAGYITPQDNGESTELTKQDQVQIDNIMAWEAQIKNLKDNIEEAKKSIMMSMKDAKEGYSESHKVVWQTINYKAQPEKVVPAKEAYTSRRFSIKELPKKD